jgi:hypothetical protein
VRGIGQLQQNFEADIHSPSHPSRLGIPQLQHSSEQNHWGCHVQHVRSGVSAAAIQNTRADRTDFPSGSIISSNIYREDDAPQYHRGNSVLLSVMVFNIVLYLSTKAYYTFRNRQRERVWNRMTESERFHYLATTDDAGNKRLDFRFIS